MNKKLEDTFDLPSMEEALEEAKAEELNSESKKADTEKVEMDVQMNVQNPLFVSKKKIWKKLVVKWIQQKENQDLKELVNI